MITEWLLWILFLYSLYFLSMPDQIIGFHMKYTARIQDLQAQVDLLTEQTEVLQEFCFSHKYVGDTLLATDE